MPFTIEELLGSKYFIIILGVTLFYCMRRLSTRKRRHFLKHGYPTLAIVLSIERTYLNKGDYDRIYEIKLEVKNEDKTVRVVTIRHDYKNHEEKPHPGDKLNILVDQTNKAILTPSWYKSRQS